MKAVVLNGRIRIMIARFNHPTLQLARTELLAFFKSRLKGSSRSLSVLNVHFLLSQGKGYSVELSEESLIFKAPSAIEILYSIYDFAERHLGFLFSAPGLDENPNPRMALKLEHGVLIPPTSPALPIRGFVQEFPFSKESYKLADWMARNRLNHLMTWMEHYDQMPDKLKNYFKVRGITIEPGHHNFNYWISPAKYYRKHPEYFAVINNKRIQPREDTNGFLLGGQLCATNPNVRKEIARAMISYARAHSEIKFLGLNPNDGFGWCECAKCRRFYDKNRRGEFFCLSEHVYRAENLMRDFHGDVSVRVRKKKPDLSISNCAYINYVRPSKNFKLTRGLFVQVAPYWRCINHSLDDPKCEVNSRYSDVLRQWAKSKQGGLLGIYEYYMGVNLYISLPMMHQKRVFREVDLLQSLKVDALLTQFQMGHWTAYGLNYWAMAKAAYGGQPSCIDDWFTRKFGKAALKARKLYTQLEKLQVGIDTCLIPYPRFLLLRTRERKFLKARQRARELKQVRRSDPFCNSLVLWTEYMFKLKQLFDDKCAGMEKVAKIDEFLVWAKHHENEGVFLYSKVAALMRRWKERLQEGKEWYHYNLDWEDAYIRKHDKLYPIAAPSTRR